MRRYIVQYSVDTREPDSRTHTVEAVGGTIFSGALALSASVARLLCTYVRSYLHRAHPVRVIEVLRRRVASGSRARVKAAVYALLNPKLMYMRASAQLMSRRNLAHITRTREMPRARDKLFIYFALCR